MKIAYADPPYIGQAKKHYGSEEVDYLDLIRKMQALYDAWALSCSSPSLGDILQMCHQCAAPVRVMAWVKPFCSFKPGVNPAYAWEPVIVRVGRKRTRQQRTARDWVSCNITLKKGLAGAKPPDFCFWLFEVLNVQPGDDFDDLFPGTGIVTRCLAEWLKRK